MDSTTNTENVNVEMKLNQENILFDIIKEICSPQSSAISDKLKAKVNRMKADDNLKHHISSHKLNTADKSTSTVLGLLNQTASELTFQEQTELNQAIIKKIQTSLPIYVSELEELKKKTTTVKSRKEKVLEYKDGLEDKLAVLQEQEGEKMELMMEWLNYRMSDAIGFSNNTAELLNFKTKILELKSKILHLQILQNVFTETNQSIKAYSEVHKDIKESLRETEHRITQLKEILDSEG